uniref:Secreted protein n=1 Tax=Arion vulgaris TaxID=1028688 RepID=A0A0B7ADY6_9EUPU
MFFKIITWSAVCLPILTDFTLPQVLLHAHLNSGLMFYRLSSIGLGTRSRLLGDLWKNIQMAPPGNEPGTFVTRDEHITFTPQKRPRRG